MNPHCSVWHDLHYQQYIPTTPKMPQVDRLIFSIKTLLVSHHQSQAFTYLDESHICEI